MATAKTKIALKRRSSGLKNQISREVQLNRTLQNVIIFTLFIMFMFIVLTTFILFYTFNFTRIIRSTDAVIKSKIDKAEKKISDNINVVNLMWDKIKHEENMFLTQDDVEDFKLLQKSLNPTNFVNVSKTIESQQQEFNKWYKSKTDKIDLFNVTTDIDMFAKVKATSKDVDKWFQEHYEIIFNEDKKILDQVFNKRSFRSDLESYFKKLSERKSLSQSLIKEVQNWPFYAKTTHFREKVLKQILDFNQEFWFRLPYEVNQISKILIPSDYIYIQPEGQLEPEYMFNPNQMIMFSEDVGSKLYLHNFNTFHISNATIRVFLWKRS